MKFAELNPVMVAGFQAPGFEGCNQLIFECPVCRRPVVIYCRLNGPSNAARAIWLWKHEPGSTDWNSVTLDPSIQDHPVSRREPPCPAHFSITKGDVVLN